MSIGEYLRRARQRKDLTLRQVEQKLKEQDSDVKVSSGHLSLIESGRVRNPSPKTLHALSEILDLDYVQLLIEADYMEPGMISNQPAIAFRGAETLTEDQRKLVEQLIDQLTKTGSRNKNQNTD